MREEGGRGQLCILVSAFCQGERERVKVKKKKTVSSNFSVSAASQSSDQGDTGMSMDGRQQGRQP